MNLSLSQDQSSIISKLLVALALSLLIFAMLHKSSNAYAAPSGVATVTITVTDTNATPNKLGGAEVTLTSSALPFPLTLKTDSAGIATFPNLPSGDFSFTASTSGYGTSSSIQTGTLSAGQTYSHTVQLVYDSNLKGIYSFNFYNTNNANGIIAGNVSWSTYGTIPNNSEMQVQFYDDQNIATGTVITTVYSNSNSNYTFTIPNTSLPTNATRLGVKLLDSNSSVIDKRTVPIWNWSSNSATNFHFKDTNENGGTINGLITWTGASDESKIAGYRIFYWVKGDSSWKYWDVIAKRADKTYQYSFASLPANTGSILIGINNSQGEELNAYPTVSVIDNRFLDTVLTSTYSSSIPVPSNINDYTYTYSQGTISGQIGWTMPTDLSSIKGFNLYFSSSNGDKLKAIGTIFTAGNAPTLYYNLDQQLTVPIGATQFALYSLGTDGSESAPTYIIFKSGLPQNIKFVDMDEHANLLHGLLTWNKALDETTLLSYQVYFLDNSNYRIGLIGEVLKGAAPQLMIPVGHSIPTGATKIGIFANDINTGISSNSVTIPLIDNTSVTQVNTAVKTTFFPSISKLGIEHVISFLNNQMSGVTFSNEDIKLFLSLIETKVIY